MKASTLTIGKEILTNKYILIALALIIVYFIIVRPLLKKNKTDYIKNIDIDANKVTISSIEAKELADRMAAEMDGLNIIVNGKFWENADKAIKTEDDAKLVFKAFGVRKGENLSQWLKSESSLMIALPSIYKSLLDKIAF